MIWIFNFWLYLMWVFDPPVYAAQVQSGAACWVQSDASELPTMGLGFTGPQPSCPYDPANTNDGTRVSN